MDSELANTQRIEIYEGPDKHGNYHFALFWMANYHPGHPQGEHALRERGQHFCAPLDRYDHVPQTDHRLGASLVGRR